MTVDIKLATVLCRETLMILRNHLTIADKLHRDYEKEIGVRGKTIDIIKPPTFTATAFAHGDDITVQDPDEDTVQATLSNFWDVSFHIPDLENTVTDRPLLLQYLEPAAIALAEKVESTCFEELTKNIVNPNSILGASNASLTASSLTAARVQLANQKAPMADKSRFYGLMSYKDEGSLLNEEKFTNSNFTGENGQAIREALMGRRYGFGLDASQLVYAPTPTDLAGTVNNGAGYAANTTTLTVSNFSAALPEGTIITFANHTSKYVVDAGTTTTSLKLKGTGLTASVVDTEAITAYNVNQNVFYHRNACALAMRPLEAPPSGTGVVAATADYGGYRMRTMIGYSQMKKKQIVSMDALWAVKMLDANLGVKYMSQK